MIVIAVIAGLLGIIGGLVALVFFFQAISIHPENLSQQILAATWQIEALLGLLILAVCLVVIIAAQAASTFRGHDR